MSFSFKPPQEELKAATPAPGGVPGATPAPAKAYVPPIARANAYDSRQEGEGMGLIRTLLIIILAIMVISTGVLFGWSSLLKSQISTKKDKLSIYEKKLDKLPLQDMRVLSSRLKVITQLVKEHPSVNSAFKILEESVENQVIYKRFDLHFSEAQKGYELALGAIAPDYRSVIEQMDTFKRKPYITYLPTVKIEGLRPDDTGKITFSLKMPIAILGVLPEGLVLKDVPETSQAPVQAVATSTTPAPSSKIIP
ncbi:MAG: hypothetical protein EXS50_02595 [Candidatus Taylorbacteria bacterium]|nr:hypothetical protein [Candidatus Taylorbacteria bacterium]